MSNTVDRRVVEMQFDNRDFERNTRQSAKTLENFKKSLDLEDSAKGLESLEKAGRKFSLDGMAKAAEAVTSKFSVLGTIGDQVIRRLTDSVYNFVYKAKNFLSDFTITPISTGFQEYETQINAVQTILSNTRDELTKKGYDDAGRLELVNEKLDQLNAYADKTIYNFTEMTRNIGTFTAAGVELDVAVDSIQGIANLAAVSGSTSEQASRAMYQLSQAISTGSVRLMDWNSVVNAGMGGKVFQDALVRTAKQMGVTIETTDKFGKKVTKTIDQVLEEGTSFRESLSHGWLSDDVLTTTLEQLSWDFENMAKNFTMTNDEHTALFDQLTKMYVGDGSSLDEARRKAEEILSDVSDMTAEEMMEIKKAELIMAGYSKEEANEIVQLAKDATEAATKVKTFTQLFDTLKEAAQSGWTQSWEYIIGDFEEAKETLTGISDFFGGLIGASADARNRLLKDWHDGGGRAMIWNNDPTKGSLGAFWNLAYGIKNIIDMVKDEFQKIFPPATAQGLLNFTQRIQEATARFKEWTEASEGIEKLRRIIAGVANGLDIIRQFASAAFGAIKDALSSILPDGNSVLEIVARIADRITALNQKLKETGSFKAMFNNLSVSLKGFSKDGLQKFVDSVKKGFDNLKKLFGKGPKDLIANIKAWISDSEGIIDTLFVAFGGAALFIKIKEVILKIKGIKSMFIDTLTEIVDDVKDLFGNLFKKENKGQIFKNILMLATSMLMLAGALYLIGQIDPDRLGTALLALGAMMAMVAGMVIFMEHVKKIKGTRSLITTGMGILFLGAAMTLFATALKEIGSMDTEAILNGLLGMAGIMAELVVFLNLSSGAKFGVFKGVGLILLAVSMSLFANAISKIGAIDTDTIRRGLVGMGAVMAELILFLNLTKRARFGVFKGTALILLAISMNQFANAISKIGTMDAGAVKQGLIGMGAVMAELVIFLNLTKKARFGVFKATSFILLAVSMKLFADAIAKIGSLDTDTVIRGVAGLGAIMLELILFLNLTKSARLGVFKGTALILLAVSMQLFADTIAKIGNLDSDTIIRGVAGLGAVLLELILFLNLTKSAKLGLFKSTSFILFAVSLRIFADTIAELGALDTASLVKGIAGLGAVMLELGIFLNATKTAQVGAFKGVGLVAVATAVLLFAETVSRLGKLKTKTIVKGVVGLGLVLLEIKAMMKLSKGVSLKDVGKMMLIVGGAAAMLWILVAALEYFNGINADTSKMGTIFAGLSVLLLSLSVSLRLMQGMSIGSALGSIIQMSLVLAAVLGICALFGEVSDALGLVSSINSFGELMESFGRAIGKFVGGIGGGILEGFSASLPQVGTDLSSFMTNLQPFIDNAKKVDGSVTSGISNLATAILAISGAEFIAALTSWFTGENPISKFVDDIGLIGTALMNFAASVEGFSSYDQTGMDNAIATAGKLAELEKALATSPASLVGWLTGAQDLGEFSTKLPAFGEAIRGFAEELSGFSSFNKTGLDNAIATATGLADLEKSLGPSPDSLIGWITGAQELDEFGTKLPAFGLAMKDYAVAISDFGNVDEADTKRAVSIATALADLEKALGPSSNSLIGWITGIQGLDDFATKLPIFGEAMKGYAASISGFGEVDDNDVTKSTAAAKALAELEKSLGTDSKSVIGWITGIQGLDDFAEKLPIFGEAMKGYAASIKGFGEVDDNDVTKSTAAAKALAELEKSLGTDSKSVIGWITGIQGLDDFATKLPIFGEAMKEYAASISGFGEVKPDDVARSTEAAKALAELEKGLGTDPNSVIGWVTGVQDLGDFATKLPIFGNAMKEYAASISGFGEVKPDDVARSTEAAKALVELEKGLGTDPNSVIGWVTGVQDLGDFATKLPIFGKAMKEYAASISGFGEVKPDDVARSTEAAKALAELEKSLGTDSKSVIGWITGVQDLGDFATKLPIFGKAMKEYAASISGFGEVKPDDVARSTAAAKALGEVEKSLGTSGDSVIGWITGVQELDEFAEKLPVFAEGMKAYATAISGFGEVKSEDVARSTQAAKALAELEQNLPSTGGILEWLIGGPDITEFAAKLPEFAEGMKRYAEKISGFSKLASTSDLKSSKIVVESLAALSESIHNTGGALQWLTGAPDLSNFAATIPEFAKGLKTYAENVQGFSKIASSNDISSSTRVLDALVTLSESIHNTGGALQWLTGAPDLSNFANTIPKFATGLKAYAENVNGFSTVASPSDISHASTTIDALAKLAAVLPAEGGLWQLVSGAPDLGNFASEFPNFAEGMKAYASHISGFSSLYDKEDASGAINVAKAMNEFITTLDPSGGVWDSIATFFSGDQYTSLERLADEMQYFGERVGKFSSGLSGMKGALADFEYVKMLIGSFTQLATSMQDGKLDFNALDRAATSIGDWLSSMNVTNLVREASGSIAAAAAEGVNDKEGEMKGAGANLTSGFANGIFSRWAAAVAAAVAVARRVIAAVKNTLDEHSPSRVGEDIGMNWDRGLANGISGYAKVVTAASGDVAKSVVDSASTMFRGNGSIFDYIDPNPTIRPVIDLSAVQNGAALINSMFAGDLMAGGLMFDHASAVAASAPDAGRNSRDVLDALRSVNERIDALNETIGDMQMVLDTGELVAGIRSKMDRALGREAAFAARRRG